MSLAFVENYACIRHHLWTGAAVEAQASARHHAAEARTAAVATKIVARPAWLSILHEVSAETGVSIAEIRGRSHGSEIVAARHKAAGRMREHGMSLAMIGRRLGGRDHSTIAHGCRRFRGEGRHPRSGAKNPPFISKVIDRLRQSEGELVTYEDLVAAAFPPGAGRQRAKRSVQAAVSRYRCLWAVKQGVTITAKPDVGYVLRRSEPGAAK